MNCEDAPADVVGRRGAAAQPPAPTITDIVVRCTYDGGTTEVPSRRARTASFAEGRAEHARITDLPGFHDEAYRATTVTGEVVRTTVTARAGTVEITVTSGATADRAQRLIDALFAAL